MIQAINDSRHSTSLRAILYARFSPRPNAPGCESCEKQIEEMRAWCEQNGYEVAAEYTDRALSGASEDRPGLWDAVYSCRRGDTLMVRSLDRLTRGDRWLIAVIDKKLRERGVRLLSITELDACGNSPMGDLMRSIFEALARYQREITKARTRAAMLRHQANGRRMSGCCPYGQQVDHESELNVHGRPAMMVEDETEREVVERIHELAAEGKSFRGICRQLTVEGYTPRGRRWHHTTIKRILARVEAATATRAKIA